MTEKLLYKYKTKENGSYAEFTYDTETDVINCEFVRYYKNDSDTIAYRRENEWLDTIEAYFSSIAMEMTNTRRNYGIRPEDLQLVISMQLKDGAFSGYKYSLKPDSAPVNKSVIFLLSEDNKVVVRHGNGHVTRELNKYPSDIIEKIEYLKKYFESNTSNDVYIENLLKGNFMELGDPVM